MSTLGSVVRQRLFGIAAGETSFEKRGFRGGSPAARARLEEVGKSFALGYHAALARPEPGELTAPLDAVPPAWRGFAYEGAGMGLALVDWLTPWNRSRVPRFLRGAGDAHSYMVHVGAGWVMARVPGNLEKFMARFDPLLRWLLVDGYGFHEGFFRWPRYLAGAPPPARVQGYARRVFDQGLGRCLWFIEGTEIPRIASSIDSLPRARQADLWSGVGLASVYAGEVGEGELRALREAAGEFAAPLGQGAAFAAKARQRAGNLGSYQDAACAILCGMSAPAAAQLCDVTLENLPADAAAPAYEIWRKRIQEQILLSATLRI